MKRIFCYLFALTLLILFLSGCGKAPMSDEWKDLKEAADRTIYTDLVLKEGNK